ncbi:MAG: hypothetical protein ACE366_31900 [Bradymonadia bacterium]
MALAGYYKARACGISMLVFGVICMMTSMFFSGSDGPPEVFTVDTVMGEIGPIEVAEDDTVLNLSFHMPVRQIKDTYNYGYSSSPNGWAVIEGELLDVNRELLFSFSDELYAESGYDDGAWSEVKNNYDLKITVPQKGVYYIGLGMEASELETGKLTIRVERMVGSTVPHFAAGFLGLLLGLVVFLVARAQIAARNPDEY